MRRAVLTVFLTGALAALVVGGCAEDVPAGEDVEVPEDDGKADAASELRVRAGETSVWMTKVLARRETADGPVFVLRGRASRNVVDGTAFVFDDPYGDFAVKSARTFEVTWPASTARSLVDGVDQFVRLRFAPSATRPDTLTARAVVRPRLLAFAGSSSIYLTAELRPVVVGGAVVYRARGSTSAAIAGLDVTANGIALTDVRTVDATHFEVDLAPDVALAIAGSSAAGAQLAVSVRLAGGQTVAKTARLGLALKRLGLTAEDPSERWPHPTCTAEIAACLQGLPDGALDLASCGDAVSVLPCAGTVGVFVDDVAFQAAAADGAARTSASAFLADAGGLVGAARRDALAFGAQQEIESRLERLFGRWYLSATARAAALAGAVDGGMLLAYARPLELVEPAVPVPGDAAATRQVAADALLGALGAYDFVHSEYARTYEDLVRQFRAQHVAGIRAFRETIAIEPHSGMPGHDVLVGNWLDPYVEVTIDRATGAATGVYIEID